MQITERPQAIDIEAEEPAAELGCCHAGPQRAERPPGSVVTIIEVAVAVNGELVRCEQADAELYGIQTIVIPPLRLVALGGQLSREGRIPT